jgi:hypothetical protein
MATASGDEDLERALSNCLLTVSPPPSPLAITNSEYLTLADLTDKYGMKSIILLLATDYLLT